TIFSLLKSTPPRTTPIGGMMMSLTSEVTTVPSAAPMMTPIARASALVLSRNALNSPIIGSSLGSVFDDLRELLRLGDPVPELLLRGDSPDDMWLRLHDALDLRGQARRIALRELRGRVDTGLLQEVGVFGSHPVDPHEVDVVDPFEDQRVSDAGRGLKVLAAARLRAGLEQGVRR